MVKDQNPSIKISQSTKSKLDQMGAKNETYDQIIDKVIDELLEYRRRCG
jgi:hypothetical protein